MKYEVTIEARVTKTYTVEAESRSDAYEIAVEQFSVLNDDAPEDYEQNLLNIKEINEKVTA